MVDTKQKRNLTRVAFISSQFISLAVHPFGEPKVAPGGAVKAIKTFRSFSSFCCCPSQLRAMKRRRKKKIKCEREQFGKITFKKTWRRKKLRKPFSTSIVMNSTAIVSMAQSILITVINYLAI